MEAEKQAVSIEVATAEFRAGVTAVLRAWSALRTAVQRYVPQNESILFSQDVFDIMMLIFSFDKPLTKVNGVVYSPKKRLNL